MSLFPDPLCACAQRDFVGIPPEPVGFDPETTDMYDRPHLMIPLKEFVQLPLVHDVVHNNAVFQVRWYSDATSTRSGVQAMHRDAILKMSWPYSDRQPLHRALQGPLYRSKTVQPCRDSHLSGSAVLPC